MIIQPLHTEIVETLETSFGILVRESYDLYPEGVSNIYLVDAAGRLVWFAELAMLGDCFSNDIVQISDSQIVCSSWKGYDCTINLSNGKLANANFTK